MPEMPDDILTTQQAPRSDRPSGRKTLFFRTVDAWIPPAIQCGDREELRRARIVVGFTLVLLALCAEALAFFHWVLPRTASRWIEISIVIGLCTTLLIPMALRRFSISTGANLIVAGSFVVLLTIFTVLGGIAAPVLHWCALMPMLALLMGARRSAAFWTGVSLLTVGAFAAVDLLGWPIMNYWSQSELARNFFWLQRVVDVNSWIGVLLMVSILYERHNDEQTAHLTAVNAELSNEIGQRKRAEARTSYLAYYDELTDLPNRELFKERLARAMSEADQQKRLVALLFLDLDGFKAVNDNLGHAHGDRLLTIVAGRLRSCVRLADSVTRSGEDEESISRLGGDEFSVLLVEIRSADEAAIVARRILAALEQPVILDDHEVFVSASIGISIYPDDSDDADGLLRTADLAMYHVKDAGKNDFEFYSESMNAGIERRATLGSDLRRALPREEFTVYYQPILNARTRRIESAEALIRWDHPVLGQLMPADFVGIAERSGLIVSIGGWVLNDVCRRARIWRELVPELTVGVNVSSVQIRTGRLAQDVACALHDFNLEASALEIEITENAMMEDLDEAARTFSEIKLLGCRISLDDFGTGYSSLSYIKRFPVDTLKIDRSFVVDVSTDPEAQAITKAMIAMAHELRLDVVAEGVETEAQDEFLTRHGCNRLQGYRFGRPMPAEQLERLFVKQRDSERLNGA